MLHVFGPRHVHEFATASGFQVGHHTGGWRRKGKGLEGLTLHISGPCHVQELHACKETACLRGDGGGRGACVKHDQTSEMKRFTCSIHMMSLSFLHIGVSKDCFPVRPV